MPRAFQLTTCACCLSRATGKRMVPVGESRQPCGKVGFSRRTFGSCAAHMEAPDRTFRILAGVKFRRLPEVAPTE